MTLEEFILEEGQRLALFQAWWRLKVLEGETTPDGDPMWPEDMMSGDWDEQFLSFNIEEATEAGLSATLENGEWIVSLSAPAHTPTPE